MMKWTDTAFLQNGMQLTLEVIDDTACTPKCMIFNLWSLDGRDGAVLQAHVAR